MTREWLAVYTALATKPKYRRLSPIGRGALLHTWILAGFQSPEATWPIDELRESLILDGFPEGALAELIGLGWLDRETGPDGELLVIHDWDQHQWAATVAARRTWEAARKKEWRHRKAAPSPAPLSPTEHHITTHHKGPGHVPDMSPTPRVDEVVAEYQRLFGHVTDKKLVYLQDIASRWDVGRVLEGLRVEQLRGATAKDICGRLESGLKGGDKARDVAAFQAIGDVLDGVA